jgi:hypothetical protein
MKAPAQTAMSGHHLRIVPPEHPSLLLRTQPWPKVGQ